MEKEPNMSYYEQTGDTRDDTPQNTPLFEEYMNNLEKEATPHDKATEIKETIAEMNSDNAVIFIAGRANGISRIDAFGVERGSKVQSETGEIEERKMSEQYAIWRLAKDIANSYSSEAPRHIRMKTLRDFSVVQRLWDGSSLDAQKDDCDSRLVALDEQMTSVTKERPDELKGKLQWIGDYVRLVEDYDNNLLRRDSIDKVASDIIPYIQEYEQYEEGLDSF